MTSHYYFLCGTMNGVCIGTCRAVTGNFSRGGGGGGGGAAEIFFAGPCPLLVLISVPM